MSLIKTAHNNLLESQKIAQNVTQFAKEFDTTVPFMVEAITHVLSELEQTIKSMNPRSVAAILAGVEKISTILPKTTDSTKKQNTIRLLTAAKMTVNDLQPGQPQPNEAVVKIAQYGASDSTLMQKYLDMVQREPQSIGVVANKLKQSIDNAMRTKDVGQNQNTLAAPQSTGLNPSSIQPTAASSTTDTQ